MSDQRIAKKKQKIVESSAKNMDKSLKDALEVQKKVDVLVEEEREELRKIYQKYKDRKRPLYEERAKFCSLVPNFWSQALSAHEMLQNLITDEDMEIFKYCTDIKVGQSFDEENHTETLRVEFHFKENPFFNNSVLFKEIKRKYNKSLVDKEEEDEEILEINQSGIDWKDEKKKGKRGDEKKRKYDELEETLFTVFEIEGDMDVEFCEIIHGDFIDNPIDFYLAANADEDVTVEEEEEEEEEDDHENNNDQE
jgi:template-activating factor I